MLQADAGELAIPSLRHCPPFPTTSMVSLLSTHAWGLRRLLKRTFRLQREGAREISGVYLCLDGLNVRAWVE
jgi:hypothetical protein